MVGAAIQLLRTRKASLMPNTTHKPARRFARQPVSQNAINATPAAKEEAPCPTVGASKPPTKAQVILGLLQREEGASLDQLVAATGWLPHTTRAALTGLKKKGHRVTSTKTDGVRAYRVVTVEGGQVASAAEVEAKVDA